MKRALFLDRDGVINFDHGYVSTPEQFDFVPGIFELCASAKAQGLLLVVVTNQAGIARGYYSEADFLALSEWMKQRFLEQHAALDAIYFCPHHPTAGSGPLTADCECRKPKPGMLLHAARDFDIDLLGSFMLGNSDSDARAAEAAGVGKFHRLVRPEDLLPSLELLTRWLGQVPTRFTR